MDNEQERNRGRHPRLLNHRWLYGVLVVLGILILGVIVASFVVNHGSATTSPPSSQSISSSSF